MKKIFIVHGFRATPNGGWRPWLMGELSRMDVYACALAMPDPGEPVLGAWIAEIARQIDANPSDDLYLVGHSLGVPAILHCLERLPAGRRVAGAVLVSGPIEPVPVQAGRNVLAFVDGPFDFEAIRSRLGAVAVLHGDDDDRVPLAHGERLAQSLRARLTVVPHGGHLNGKSGWTALPQALDALKAMFGELPG